MSYVYFIYLFVHEDIFKTRPFEELCEGRQSIFGTQRIEIHARRTSGSSGKAEMNFVELELIAVCFLPNKHSSEFQGNDSVTLLCTY